MRHLSGYRKIGLAALFAVLVLALPAVAQNNTLEVKCVDQANNPVPGAKIVLQQLGVNKAKDKKSDAKGIAAFNKLDDGAYRVLGRKEGLAPAFYEFAALKGAAQQSVTLSFQPGSPETKLYFEDPALRQKGDALLAQGVQALQAGKFADAEKQIREAIEINPSNPDGSFNLAVALLNERNWDQAEESLKKVVMLTEIMMQMQSNSPYAQMNQQAKGIIAKLPMFRLRTEADKASAERKFEDAIAKYKESLKYEANDPDLYYNLGLAQANGKHFDEALESAEKAIQLKPGEAAYRDLKKKIEEFKLNDTLIKAKGILGEGDELYKTGKYAEALKKYQEALPMVPEKNQGAIWAQMGRSYAKLKQGDQAVQAFKKAIEVAPEQPDFRKAMAQYYMDEKKYEEALNLYADPRAGGSTPPDQLLFQLGQSQSKQGNGEIAEQAFEKALQINPQNAEANFELGALFYFSKKNDKRAKELLTKYLELGKNKDNAGNAQSMLAVIKRRSP